MAAYTGSLADWHRNGFARAPECRVAGDQGLLMYRCWGTNSKEWGRFFSTTKPSSVSDAELKYNIIDWGNGVRQVSTFRLKPGFPYFIGPVRHGPKDIGLPAVQIFVEEPLQVKIELVQSGEVIKQDVHALILNSDGARPGQERGQA